MSNVKNWGSSHRYIYDDSGIVTEVITHAHEPGKVYTRRTQPSADLILERNKRMQIEQPERDLSFGRHIANIPYNDLFFLQKKYPDLLSPDKQIRQTALMKILKSPEGAKYLVVERKRA